MNVMRTLKQAVNELKAADPCSAVSYNTLYIWVRSGILPSVKAGSRYLIDMDVLTSFLKGGDTDDKKNVTNN